MNPARLAVADRKRLLRSQFGSVEQFPERDIGFVGLTIVDRDHLRLSPISMIQELLKYG